MLQHKYGYAKKLKLYNGIYLYLKVNLKRSKRSTTIGFLHGTIFEDSSDIQDIVSYLEN